MVPVQDLGEVEDLIIIQSEDGVTRGEHEVQADVTTNLSNKSVIRYHD